MTAPNITIQALEQALLETGVDLQHSVAEIGARAAERGVHLASIANEPGYAEAVIAERDALAIYAGIEAVERADSADEKARAMAMGILHVWILAAVGGA